MRYPRRGISTRYVAVTVILVILAVGTTYAVVSSTRAPPSTSTTTSTATTTATAVSTSTATSIATSISTSTSTSVSTSVSLSTVTSTTTTLPSGGTVVVEEASGPDTLDPATQVTFEAAEAQGQVYQSLVAFGTNSSVVFPLLASSYTISPDGLTYTFSIRQGMKFSNGDPLNAYVFWYSIYRGALVAGSNAYYVTSVFNITGVTPDMLNKFNTADNIPPSDLLQVMQNPSLPITAPGPYQLVMHLTKPFAPLLSYIATTPIYYAVDARLVSQNGGVQAGQPNTWLVSHAVGTGPFVITSYTPNSVTVFEKNPTYWGGVSGFQPTPRVDKVIVKVVPDDLTRLKDLERGSSQLTYTPFSLIPQIAGVSGIYIPNYGPEGTIHYIGMDTQKFPTNITLVRSAIVHAVNYSAVLHLYHGLGIRYVGPLGHGFLGYDESLQPYSYNLTLARQLLAQAGFPNGQGLPTLNLIVPSNRPPAPDVAQVVQANLADVGIQVKLNVVPAAQRNNILANTKPTDPAYPELQYLTVFSPLSDPQIVAPYVIGPAGRPFINSAWYTNPKVDAWIAQDASTANVQQRIAIYKQIDATVYQDVPYVWIAQFQNSLIVGVPIVSTHVQGVTGSVSLYGYDFSTIFLSS